MFRHQRVVIQSSLKFHNYLWLGELIATKFVTCPSLHIHRDTTVRHLPSRSLTIAA